MNYEHLPNKRYKTLCNAMEEEGWTSHSVACCLGDYGKGEKLPTSLKRSRTFAAYRNHEKRPVFDNSGAKDMYLVFRDVNGHHPVRVRVNFAQSLVRSPNGSNDKFGVAYLEDVKSGLTAKLTPRLRKPH